MLRFRGVHFDRRFPVKRIATALSLLALGVAGMAAAQTSPSQTAPPAGTTPPSQYPSATSPSSTEAPSTNSSGTSSKTMARQQIKDCIAQQRANNSTMSKHELKKYCKEQLSGGSPQ